MLAVKERVLLVDDEPQILVALEDLLSDEYTVLTSATPEQALELVREDPQIAVVITDQRMPHMNGDEFLSKIGANSRALRIMVSGFADLPSVLRAVNEGKVYAYVTKPWNEEDLLRKVHSAAEHFRLAEALAYERQLLRDLMDNSPDGIYFKDADLRFLRANAAFAKSIGKRLPEELVGRRLSEILGEESQRDGTAEDRIVLHERKPVVDSVRRLERAGEAHFVSETKAPIRGPLGAAVGVVGITRDVTERITTAEALKASEALLQHRTDVLNSVLNGMADGVAVTALDGQTVVLNEQASRVLGVANRNVRAEDWPKTYGLYAPNGKTLLSDAENPVCCAMSGQPFAETEIRIENSVVRGALVAVTATPLRDASGAIVGAITLLRDVTEQRSLEQQLAQSQRMEAIGRLAGGVAHDFNNLLTVIVGCGELTLEDLDPGDARRGNVNEILAAANHATLLTRQLLAFGRQEVIHPTELQLNDVLSGIESTLRRFAGDRIQISLRLCPELCLIAADLGQIEQIILNLVVNSRDAMPDGGQLEIETSEVRLNKASAAELGLERGRYARLTVTDNGSGMTEETRKRLFEPFFTTKEFGKGTGLGLSTVYGIVHQNLGQVRVQSTLGTGTEFEVLLPQTRQTVPIPSSIPPAMLGLVTANVLVIESDPAIRQIAARLLRAEGHSVLEAARVGDAQRLLSEHPQRIDLLLTDIGEKEAELAAELAGNWPSLRTIFMTGGVSAPKRDGEPVVGKYLVLAKPFSRVLLLDVVRQALSPEGGSMRPNAV